MHRIKRGWHLAKASLRVVRGDPALSVLVVVGVVLAAIVAVPGVVAGAVVSEGDEPRSPGS